MKKLKNKKYNFTVIFESLNVCGNEYVLRYKFRMTGDIKELRYNSFEEIKEDWEEFLPKNSMICGEEHIKMFKAWAEYSGNTEFLYDGEKDCLIANFDDEDRYKMYFSFTTLMASNNLINNTVYTLSELLGDYED